MDVALVLDRSSFLDPESSSWVVSLSRLLVSGLPVWSGDARIAVVAYGDNATVAFQLNSYNSTSDVMEALTFDDMGTRSHLQVCVA